MKLPAAAVRPLVALAVVAASIGCIAPPAYAENATAAVVSADGNHVVVDVDLNGDASDVGSDDQSESVSDAETDKTWKAFETLMTANNIIIEAAFYFFCLPLLFAAALILVLYKLFWPQRWSAVLSPHGWTEPVSGWPFSSPDTH